MAEKVDGNRDQRCHPLPGASAVPGEAHRFHLDGYPYSFPSSSVVCTGTEDLPSCVCLLPWTVSRFHQNPAADLPLSAYTIVIHRPGISPVVIFLVASEPELLYHPTLVCYFALRSVAAWCYLYS